MGRITVASVVVALGLVATGCGDGEPGLTEPARDAAPDTSAAVDAAPSLDAGGDAAPPLDGSRAPKPAYYVANGKLYDPCGEELILRGVNKMAVFADRKGDSFPEIAKTGANVVRFMWLSSVPASEAVQTIQRAIDAQLVPMWELHDATGDFSKMPTVEAFWTDPGTIAVLKQFESRLLVNLANEAGQTVADPTWSSTYTGLVGKLRAAGLRMPFVIDAAGYGRNVEQLLKLAPGLLAADPQKNLIFSWHEYDSGAGESARIDAAFATATNGKIPFIVGEFAHLTPGACGNAVPYQHLMTAAHAKGIGWMPWSWDDFNGDCKPPNGPSPFDMVGDGIHLSTLKSGWATEVVQSDPSSIQKTAKRTGWQTSKAGTCP
jgi:mannan endo-1,4-beta-mannosidase